MWQCTGERRATEKETGETQEEQRVGSSIDYCQWIVPEARRGPPKKTTEKLLELTQCWEAELAFESQRESLCIQGARVRIPKKGLG